MRYFKILRDNETCFEDSKQIIQYCNMDVPEELSILVSRYTEQQKDCENLRQSREKIENECKEIEEKIAESKSEKDKVVAELNHLHIILRSIFQKDTISSGNYPNNNHASLNANDNLNKVETSANNIKLDAELDLRVPSSNSGCTDVQEEAVTSSNFSREASAVIVEEEEDLYKNHVVDHHTPEKCLSDKYYEEHPRRTCLICAKRHDYTKYGVGSLDKHILRNHAIDYKMKYNLCSYGKDTCTRHFTNLQVHRIHALLAHKVRKDYYEIYSEFFYKETDCPICDKHFISANILSRHLNKKHVGAKGILTCDHCGFSALTRMFMRKHLFASHNKGFKPPKLIPKSHCLICAKKGDETAYNIRKLDTHILQNHENPCPYYIRCPQGNGNCERHFKNKDTFQKHIKREHKDKDLKISVDEIFPSKKYYFCTRCLICWAKFGDDTTYENRTLFHRHEQEHRQQKDSIYILCPFEEKNNDNCYEYFRNQTSLVKHVRHFHTFDSMRLEDFSWEFLSTENCVISTNDRW